MPNSYKPRSILGKSSKGFSLIEVIIVGGLLGGLSLIVGSLVKTGSQGQKTLQAQDDARVLTQDMAAVLSNPMACANTFGGAPGSPNASAANPVDGNGTSVKNIVDGSLNAQFKVGTVYGNRGLELVGITIGGTGSDSKSNIQKWTTGTDANTGTAFVQVSWQQTGSAGNQGNGPQILYRYFMVFVSNLGSGNQIINCTAQAGGAYGYWTLSSSNSIYNNNNGGTGFVGVGSSSPMGNFDIENGNGTATLCLNGKCAQALPHASIAVYQCPVLDSCNDGQTIAGQWASFGCLGQVSSQSTCSNQWYAFGYDYGGGGRSCSNSCTYLGILPIQ